MRRTCLPGAATPSTAIFPRAILRWCWFLVPHLWGGLCEPHFAGSLCQTAESHFGRAVPPRLDSRQDAREGVRCAGAMPPAVRRHSVSVPRPPLQQEPVRTVGEFYRPLDAWHYAASRRCSGPTLDYATDPVCALHF